MRQPALLVTLVLAIVAWLAPCAAHAQSQPAASASVQRITLPAATPAALAAGGSVQFIGTATVLIRYLGLTILTDRNFLHKGEHAHLGYGLQAERLTEPALAMSQLPPIDLVLLSHFHEDHFDTFVQQHLARNTLIVTTPHAADRLRQPGFQHPLALERWAALEISKGEARLTITAMPGRHGLARVSALLPPVMGSMLDFTGPQQGQRYRMYFSGDTLIHDEIAHIPQRFPNFDLALLHLGGTRILKVLKVTMVGQDDVDMLRIIAPAHAIPIHYNDYDVLKLPLSEFERPLHAAGLENKVSYLQPGQSYAFRIRH